MDIHTSKQEEQNSWMACPSTVFSELGLNLYILVTQSTPIDLTGLPQNMHSFWQNVLQFWLRLRRKYSDRSNHVYTYLNSAIWNNSHFNYKHKNLHMKDWITNGIDKIKDILHKDDQMSPFSDLERKVRSSPSHLFEYNAVKTALNNAKQQNRFYLFENIEQNARSMTIQGQTPASMKAKDFRKLLDDGTQPCATNFWNRQLNVCIYRQHWELAFNSTQETRLWVLH